MGANNSDNALSSFTYKSGLDAPQNLLGAYNHKLLVSLDRIFGRSKSFQNVLFGISCEKRLKPSLFLHYSNVLDLIKRNEIARLSNIGRQIHRILLDPYSSDFEITTISKEPIELQLMKDLSRRNSLYNNTPPTIESVPSSVIKKVTPYVNDALTLIKKVNFDFFSEFKNYISNLVMFESNLLVGMSDPRMFGKIYLCAPDLKDYVGNLVYFCEHIIHETSHHHLFTLFSIDKIILNSPEERYPAPIRPDLRPMYGIFHATYVLSRMVSLFDQICQTRSDKEFFEALKIFRQQFEKGHSIISKHAVLTDMGKQIVKSYDQLLQGASHLQ